MHCVMSKEEIGGKNGKISEKWGQDEQKWPIQAKKEETETTEKTETPGIRGTRGKEETEPVPIN